MYTYFINLAKLNMTNQKLIYILIPAILVLAAVIFFAAIIRNTKKEDKDNKEKKEKKTIEDAINFAGYEYDAIQDIFFSKIDAWQKKYGYCRLYDEACAPLSMIIDCEPIYFDYDGKHWMIEFWKGQYGLTAGCEVGVYNTKGLKLNIPGVFNGTFYETANEEDFLDIAYTLYKNKTPLFERKAKHWWLTGFKLGEFAEPYELTMDIKIVFKDGVMRNAFVNGLKNAGYKSNEIRAINNVVNLTFDTPYTKQPYTRTQDIEYIMQTRNQINCEKYRSLTKGIKNLEDKINILKQNAPDIYNLIFNIGKTQQVFNKFEIIKKYLNIV